MATSGTLVHPAHRHYSKIYFLSDKRRWDLEITALPVLENVFVSVKVSYCSVQGVSHPAEPCYTAITNSDSQHVRSHNRTHPLAAHCRGASRPTGLGMDPAYARPGMSCFVESNCSSQRWSLEIFTYGAVRESVNCRRTCDGLSIKDDHLEVRSLQNASEHLLRVV